MANRRTEPYGRTFTAVVLILGETSMTTSEGIAERLWGKPDAELVPTGASIRAADLLMARMVTMTGLVRRARPWARGNLWALSDDGLRAYAELVVPRQRRQRRTYKTTSIRRLKQRHRRNTQSGRQRDGTRLRCINENLQGTHGPPTHGCRCYACYLTHRGKHDDSRARGDRPSDCDRGAVGSAGPTTAVAPAVADCAA